MHPLFAQLVEDVGLTGDICADMIALLLHHGFPSTVDHSLRVSAKAVQLATHFGIDPTSAQIAGWLHDVSAVLPIAQRAEFARQLGLAVLPEEETAPMVLHQKLSARMAQNIFAVGDAATLSAIECHTTLKADASTLDKVVFLADKIAWDQPGDPPYLEDVHSALSRSLDDAVYRFLDYWWQQRDSLLVVHPWFAEAYRQSAALCAVPSRRPNVC